jgi:hypothetical protein
VAAATRYEEQVPATYVDLVAELADITGRLSDCLEDRGRTADLRPQLLAIATRSSEVATPAAMSSTVVIAQVRSIVVDLLELTGLDEDEALSMIPRPG